MSDADDNTDESLAQRRSRRTRSDKSGRLAALEKLRNLKDRGSKNKYEVKDVNNVYDVVDEDEYCRKVNERVQDDWIVDDGTGYYETGHELFDEDLVEDGWGKKRKAKSSAKTPKLSKEEKESQKAGFLSVREMLAKIPTKRRKTEGASTSTSDNKIDNGEMLGDLLEELHKEKKPRSSLPNSQRLLENAQKMDRLMSSSKIKEDSPFSAAPKIAVPKKKFEVFKPNSISTSIKQEPVDDYDDFPSSSAFDEPFPTDDEIQTLENTAVKVEPKLTEPSVKPEVQVTSSEEIKEIQFQEVENVESYRQVDVQASEADVEFISTDEESSNKVMNFFWYDVFEEPKNPGYLYLFGKVNANGRYQSCCIVLKNVQRVMYLLPSNDADQESEITFTEMHQELSQKLQSKFKVGKFMCRPVEKKYCFKEPNVPSISEYLELRYSGTIPPLPEDLSVLTDSSGKRIFKTISRVFGANASMVENFLLEKSIKGPCWLKIINPELVESGQQHSWCKMEYTCDVKNVKIHPEKDSLTIPPFVVASLNVNFVNDPGTKKETIVMASVCINKNFTLHRSVTNQTGIFHDSFCLINKPPSEVWPVDLERTLEKQKFAQKMDSERSLLACFLAKLCQYDVDIYVGHDLNFDSILLQLWTHKVPHWSRIGRLKRAIQPHKNGKMPDVRSTLVGRLVCDVKTSAMELIRARSYDIPTLAAQVLGEKNEIVIYTGPEFRELFETTKGIIHLTQWGMYMSILNFRLVNQLQVMPLALQITAIAGNTLSRTLCGGRSERNEFLLLHAFHSKGYIVPDKRFGKRVKEEEDENSKDKDGKSGPSYVGGLVLDPKKGFYDNFIVLMDFNSLYPSIIQEYNICFTTSTNEHQTDDGIKGILPEEIRRLVESRREVKKLMKAENLNPELRRQYDIRQMALKLTANSMYGCLGFRNSRFFAKNLAALITGKGRDILMKTKEHVEGMGFEVIYGDTDSIMIDSKSQDIQAVYKIGNKIKAEINKMYKLLELEIDGVFRFLLLLKKKKYAALTYSVKSNGDVETSLELKGLDIVRRDWAPVAASTAKAILNEIMTEQPLDDKVFKAVKILNDKSEELRAGDVPLNELQITKQLTKNPEEYKDKQGLYHVQVAIKMNQSGRLNKKFKNGDTVAYIFCNDGSPHHISELKQSTLKTESIKSEDNASEQESKPAILLPDPLYYLSQQVHPVVSRICEPIPGLDAARIAEALGLDPSSYKRKRVVEDVVEDKELGEISEAEKYKGCEPFKFLCANAECKKEFEVSSALVNVDGQCSFSLNQCSHCGVSPYDYINRVANALRLSIRRFIERYYEGWYSCEDPACGNRDKAIPLRLERGFIVCSCKQGVMVKEYSEVALNEQLNYFLYIFNIEKCSEELSLSEEDKGLLLRETIPNNCYKMLTDIVKECLRHSEYSEIRIPDIFAEMVPQGRFKFNRSSFGD